MRRTLSIALCLLLAALSVAPIRVARSDAPPARHLYLVLLPGICGWAGSDPYCHDPIAAGRRAQGTFHALLSALPAAHIRATTVPYSYRAGAPSYTVAS